MGTALSTMSMGVFGSKVLKCDKADRGAYIKEHIACNAKTLLADTVVIGGVVVGLKKLSKSTKFVNAMSKATQKLCEGLNKAGWKKIAQKISKLPSKYKVFAPILLAGGLALLGINSRSYYNRGRIDQKYADRAQA